MKVIYLASEYWVWGFQEMAPPALVVQAQSYGPVRINSSYDSGNIEVVDASNPRDIQLRIRPDPYCEHDKITHYQCGPLIPAMPCELCLLSCLSYSKSVTLIKVGSMTD